jgi:hypothetical protein
MKERVCNACGDSYIGGPSHRCGGRGDATSSGDMLRKTFDEPDLKK